jgi:NAD(P)H-quinone oxidoreductase subunit 5
LRAPTLLHDYHTLENALGAHLSHRSQSARRWISPAVSSWFYRLAVERGFLDTLLADNVARPILRVFSACDSLERRWTDFLSGGRSRESDELAPTAGSLEKPT